MHSPADKPHSLTALALDLGTRAAASAVPVVFIDATVDRLEPVVQAVASLFPSLTVLAFPPWDSLPYDRSPPSHAVVGQRVATLAALASAPVGGCLVLTTARAVLGRLPPPARFADAAVTLTPGQAIDAQSLQASLDRFGYEHDATVTEPGQVAVHSHVIDVFAGDAAVPHRILLEDGVVQAIHRVDTANQRSVGETEAAVTLRPVMDLTEEDQHDPGLVCLLDYIPDAELALPPETEPRWGELQEQIEDAYGATVRARRAAPTGPDYLAPPSLLYLQPDQVAAVLARHRQLPGPFGAAPALPAMSRPSALEAAIAEADGPVIVAAGQGAARLQAALARRGRVTSRLAGSWEEALASPGGSAAILSTSVPDGCVWQGATVLTFLVAEARSRARQQLVAEEPPRFGDIVVHRGHGVCRLKGLSQVGGEERIALEFANETELLVPLEDLGQIWRYGSDAGHQALDRVDGPAWRRREQEITVEIARTAHQLGQEAEARARLAAPVIEPPGPAFGRFVRRFPYPLSPDQADAIDATLGDMRAGRPMDRLICGDVGFGKTEVALRAAAAAALAGYQVAIVAPTTVLARQHAETFERRLSGLNIRVARMLRGGTAAEAGAVRQGLADGSIDIVVGTQAIAAAGVSFKNLALVVIDEEQRFGDADKKRLAGLRCAEGGVHSLVMTATPIPRTLQTALVGLRAVSVIATAPMRRQPTRTFVLPWDPVVVREALMREHGRGGQSFVIVPRVEDIAGIAARLAEPVPELSTVVAHGKLKPQALEDAVADFAAGAHDVLLATNIIEAGLDIPRANTILVTRPDRFGLAQLHQMRGRVGRGTRRSFAYMLTEPGTPLAPPTQRRLHTMETQEQLGAGIAISLADMDTRGAGDLFGDKQAGHVHAIGTELYQYLLGVELAAAHGAPRPSPPPVLHTETAAQIPADYIPEPGLRLELYRRLARLGSVVEAEELEHEIEDRFGAPPEAVVDLLRLARLRAWCQAHGVVRVDAGPQAVALTAAGPREASALAEGIEGSRVKADRVVIAIAVRDASERLGMLLSQLG